MIEAQSGTILVTTGGGSIEPVPMLANVTIAAAGLRNWTMNLHKELKQHGIYVAHIAISAWIGKGHPAEPAAIAAAYPGALRDPRRARTALRRARQVAQAASAGPSELGGPGARCPVPQPTFSDAAVPRAGRAVDTPLNLVRPPPAQNLRRGFTVVVAARMVAAAARIPQCSCSGGWNLLCMPRAPRAGSCKVRRCVRAICAARRQCCCRDVGHFDRSCVEYTLTPLRCSRVSRCHGVRRITAPPRSVEHSRELPTTRAPLDATCGLKPVVRERSAIRGRGVLSLGCLSTVPLRARRAIDESPEPAGRASPTRGQGSPLPRWRRGCPPRSSAGCRG